MEYIAIRKKGKVIQIAERLDAVDSWACKSTLERWGYKVIRVNVLNRIAVVK